MPENNTVRETCPCGAEWEGPSTHAEDRMDFRAAHQLCRNAAQGKELDGDEGHASDECPDAPPENLGDRGQTVRDISAEAQARVDNTAVIHEDHTMRDFAVAMLSAGATTEPEADYGSITKRDLPYAVDHLKKMGEGDGRATDSALTVAFLAYRVWMLSK